MRLFELDKLLDDKIVGQLFSQATNIPSGHCLTQFGHSSSQAVVVIV
ncbi:MAG: hypothetical protein LBE20_06530 [Deltaproteobacteria bacterium]|nr:hypothetical protein [Deltaproteobacteria bacterium]